MAQAPHREVFFKYSSASTAIKILERSAVRYSSPLIFNDPFDIQSGLHLPFDTEEFPEKVLQRIRELVASPTRPEVNEEDEWGKAITLIATTPPKIQASAAWGSPVSC
jgi:hypothetical protein